MSPAPRLTTDRLVLRGWEPADREPYTRMVRDREVMEHMTQSRWRRLLPRLAARRDLRSFDRQWESQEFGTWAVELMPSGGFVGRIGLTPAGWGPAGSLEIGWMLVRSGWGHGYATEGAGAVLDYAFHHLGLDRVLSVTRPANERSVAVIDRLGFQREDGLVSRNETQTPYALSRDRWPAAQPPARPAP